MKTKKFETQQKIKESVKNGILLPKLLHTVRKNCSSDREKILKLEQLEFKLKKKIRIRKS